MRLLDRISDRYNKDKFYKSIKNKIHDKHIFLLGTPLHGNIGDQAIAMAEIKFLNEKFPEYEIIEIPDVFLRGNIKKLKNIIKDDMILLHGGGFIGSLWPVVNDMLNNIISTFCNNDIIIFPQTVYFENNDNIRTQKEIFEKAKKLIICCREKYSFEFCKKHFNVNTILCPDMVTYLSYNKNVYHKKDIVIFCKRSDKENVIDESEFIKIVDLVKNTLGLSPVYSDTVVDYDIDLDQRNELVLEKIKEFGESKLVITDRLHGMVLSALANTPCIAMSNINWKVKGIYEWIANNNYIKYCDNISDFNKKLQEILEFLNTDNTFDNTNLNNYFNELADIIERRI